MKLVVKVARKIDSSPEFLKIADPLLEINERLKEIYEATRNSPRRINETLMSKSSCVSEVRAAAESPPISSLPVPQFFEPRLLSAPVISQFDRTRDIFNWSPGAVNFEDEIFPTNIRTPRIGILSPALEYSPLISLASQDHDQVNDTFVFNSPNSTTTEEQHDTSDDFLMEWEASTQENLNNNDDAFAIFRSPPKRHPTQGPRVSQRKSQNNSMSTYRWTPNIFRLNESQHSLRSLLKSPIYRFQPRNIFESSMEFY